MEKERLRYLIAVGAALARRAAVRAAGWAVAGLALAALLATGARAAALGLAMASPVLALALSPWDAGAGAGRARIRIWAATGAMLVLAAGVFVLRSPGQATAADPTRVTRGLMRDVARDLFGTSRLLGVGPGQYGLRFLDGAAKRLEDVEHPPIYPGITMEAHCEPLQALAERGLLGALAWLAALFAALGVARARGPIEDPIPRARFLAALASLIALAVAAQFGFPFHVFPTAVLFLWVVAAASAAGTVPAVGDPGPALTAWSRLRAIGYLALIPLAGRDLVGQAALGANTEPALRSAIRALPADGQLRFRLALGLRSAGRIDEAEQEFELALPGHPDPDVRFNLGKIALDRKDYAKAAEHFDAGLRTYPFFSAPAWADYALALQGLKRTGEARVAARRAVAVDPGIFRTRPQLKKLR